MAAFRPKRIAPSPDIGSPEMLQGTIERITFHNPENGYTIAALIPNGKRFTVPIVGTFSNPIVGESIICKGSWTTHPKWGKQMQVAEYERVRPATAIGVEKYLGSGLIKGIGPVMAKRIVEKFGVDALDVIENHPEKLKDVEGVGEKRAVMIGHAWADQREIRHIMLFLQGHGVSTAYAIKIYKQYGSKAIETVENNPYQLAKDVWGIGFKVADKIAQKMGIAVDDPRRIEAGVAYVLMEAVSAGGNVYLTQNELVAQSKEILQVDSVDNALDRLCESHLLIREEAQAAGETEIGVYTPALYAAERGLAEKIIELIDSRERPLSDQIRKIIDDVLEAQGFELSREQSLAVAMALTASFSVLTGGPGTGKTTATRAIVAAFERLGRNVLLASPTGRAAKRLSEVVEREAKTIHRLLEYNPESNGFKRNSDNTLDCDVIIVDESSMLDTTLAYHLIKSIPQQAQIVFVGDVDQLPSVGPGNVLRDIIESDVVPVTRLTQVFRQAAESMIVTNAHRINRGVIPKLPKPSEGQDCVYISVESAEELADKIIAVVAKSLPTRGFSLDDIQVLSPMQRGAAGAVALNERLQQVLNPARSGVDEVERGGRIYRVGDRVMQIVNDYDKAVYNGDIGKIIHISQDDAELCVDYAGVKVYYPFTDLDELVHAYACSIHKSQGSEYPAVVIAIHTQHYMLLQRNLIYTALTRARKMAVIVGTTQAIAMAVKKQGDIRRHTRLKERLMGKV